ncbi:MAG TPA: hypothetical protein PKC98_16110 [Candidatus Melainabacteria bacterium]|nr:hypothetical protein [Candidatus Melainabacteria bacterium]
MDETGVTTCHSYSGTKITSMVVDPGGLAPTTGIMRLTPLVTPPRSPILVASMSRSSTMNSIG